MRAIGIGALLLLQAVSAQAAETLRDVTVATGNIQTLATHCRKVFADSADHARSGLRRPQNRTRRDRG